MAANKPIDNTDSPEYRIFKSNLEELLDYMAKEIVKDGEGITKLITIVITGAPDRKTAKTIAMSIANSPLVKTSIFGEDLNWGRILMAIGKAGTGLNFGLLDLFINDYAIVLSGEPVLDDACFQRAKSTLKQKEITIKVNIHKGDAAIKVLTCDFSYRYVEINASYTT